MADCRCSCLPAQEWLVNEKQLDVFGMKLAAGFQLIGQVVGILAQRCSGGAAWRRRGKQSVQIHAAPGAFTSCFCWWTFVSFSPLIKRFPLAPQGLPDYTKWLTHYSTQKQDHPAKPIRCRSYARSGWRPQDETCFRLRRVQSSELCVHSQGGTNGESLRWILRENRRHVHLQLLG